MADELSELKSLAELAVEYLDLLVTTTKDLADAQKETNEAIKENTKATKAATAEKEKERKASESLTASAKKLGTELLNIANAGVKLGSALGVSAVRGVEIELKNRLTSAAQLLNFNANLQVTVENLKAAQAGFAQSFVGAAEGMQISSRGSRDFVRSLNEGFKSEFEPTAETFRMLTQMGMTTTEQFDAFRKATGRASLSNAQLTTLYNKNQLSFLLYGNSFGKAAVQAERLGVNLASIQAAQESLVTNLDGTIDTVAQINQLGGQIDFGSLVRIAEQDGPDALMAYVRATVPEQMMQSASTRALFKQLGISVEDYMKSGNKQVSAADELEKKMTEQVTQTNAVIKALSAFGAWVSKTSTILTGTFGALTLAALSATKALFGVGGMGAMLPGLSKGIPGLLSYASTALQIAPVLSAVTAGVGVVGGGALGKSMGGSTLGSFGGSSIGTIIGGLIGTAIAPGVGTYIGMSLGGLAGGALGGAITKSEDMFSAGYGTRTLVTPKGAFALNNADDIIAGTNLFPKGALRAGSDNTELMRKIDNLISSISSANTTINVGGSSQTVPRIQLVGVYSRNEVR